jgi:aryl-alcohol dehydrogenase-like predicted oxidoreductase
VQIAAAVDEMAAMAAAYGKTPGQMAVAWVLSQPGVTVALWGAKRPDQIEECDGATGWTLTAEEMVRLEALFEGI